MGVVLTTARVIIREFTAQDALAMFAWVDEPAIRKFLRGPTTLEETQEHVTRMILSSQASPRIAYDLGVVLREEQRLVGAVSLHVADEEPTRGWLAYALAAECRGLGLATEAARELVRFGFDELHLREIRAYVDPTNSKSVALLQRLGMVYQGLFAEDEEQHLYALSPTPATP